MTTVRIWKFRSGDLHLRPDFSLLPAEWTPVGAELSPELELDGVGWWPVLRRGGVTVADALPPDAVLGHAEPPGANLERPVCKVLRSRVTDAGGADSARLSHEQALALLSSPLIADHQRAARDYWRNAAVREVVRNVLQQGHGGREELTGAYIVAAMVADGSLWESVSGRAGTGDFSAERALSRWPDPRGVAFFAASLNEGGRGRQPLLLNSLAFFLGCCEDQGLAFVAASLGDPFAGGSVSPAQRRGRLAVGESLLRAEGDLGVRPSVGWLEYLAAVLLVERIRDEDDAVASDGLRVLLTRADPRLPVVASRLIFEGLCDDEDVEPCLLAVPGEDARRVVAWLMNQAASSARIDGDKWLHGVLSRVAARLGVI